MRRAREDGGQAAVELALVLPVVCLLLLAVVQIGLVVHAQLVVVHAAREGARAAAVDPHPAAARIAVLAGTPLGPDDVTVVVTDSPPGRVRVEVQHRFSTDVPIVGGLLGDVELSATSVMRREYE